jgi:hypothetical protein
MQLKVLVEFERRSLQHLCHPSMVRRLAVALMLLPCSLSCAAPTSPSPEPWNGRVAVSGRIIDFLSDAGIAGARVAIGGTTPTTATTDASGFYSLSVPSGEQEAISVNDRKVAIFVRMVLPTFRGDYYDTNGTDCAARYGLVVDQATRRPLSGASVRIAGYSANADRSGWYKLSAGCGPCLPGNTTMATISYPSYADGLFSVGRGFCGVSRVDVELQRR